MPGILLWLAIGAAFVLLMEWVIRCRYSGGRAELEAKVGRPLPAYERASSHDCGDVAVLGLACHEALCAAVGALGKGYLEAQHVSNLTLEIQPEITRGEKVMDEERKAWLETLPPIVRALAERFDSDVCYRLTSTSDKGHYIIVTYASNGTLTMAHGRDSFDPGMTVFGVPADDVLLCGCGKWEPPTKAQITAKQQEVARLHARRTATRRHN